MRIRTQLALVVFCAGTIGIGGMVADRALVLGEIMEKRAQARADAIVEALSVHALPAVKSGDSKGVRRAAAAFSSLPGVEYLSVLDQDGAPLYQTPGPKGRRSGIEAVEPLTDKGRSLGSAHVEISTHGIREGVFMIARRGAALGVAILLLLGLLSWQLGRGLGRKIEALLGAVEHFDDPLLSRLPDADGQSEVGRLSRAFQNLHDRLRSEEARRRELEAARDDLSSMLVHDLKHPLTVMKMVLAVLEEHGSDGHPDRVATAMRLAKKSVDRLDGMITNILHVSRIANADVPIERHRLLFGEFIKGVADENAALVENSGLAWSCELEEVAAGRWIEADRALLRRLVGNLVMNAVEHSPRAGRISLGGRMSRRYPGHVVLSVRDEGEGVPPEIAGKIFDKYSSFSQSTRNVGLGLAFCKMAAGTHGGRLEVIDKAMPGATFAAILPSTERAPSDLERKMAAVLED